uniref:Protein kinase domain-containing protein n=1 Tax=Anas zonorhyncha TaxID=75864 RepID=A0A8B9ZZS0_9AVES
MASPCVLSPRDGRVSENTVCLIRKLLVLDPQQRLTASEVLDSLSSIIASWQSMSSLSGPLQVVPDIDDQVANPENPQEVGAGGLPLVLGLRFCGGAFFGLAVLGALPWAASPAGPAALSTCMPQAAFPRPCATFPPRIPIPHGLQPAELHGSELAGPGSSPRAVPACVQLGAGSGSLLCSASCSLAAVCPVGSSGWRPRQLVALSSLSSRGSGQSEAAAGAAPGRGSDKAALPQVKVTEECSQYEFENYMRQQLLLAEEKNTLHEAKSFLQKRQFGNIPPVRRLGHDAQPMNPLDAAILAQRYLRK